MTLKMFNKLGLSLVAINTLLMFVTPWLCKHENLVLYILVFFAGQLLGSSDKFNNWIRR
jgi:hypothetical protein